VDLRAFLEVLRDVGALAILAFLAWKVPPLLHLNYRILYRIEGFLLSQGMRREETPSHTPAQEGRRTI